MKKITESQLKNRVNGLREYMVSLAEVAFSSEQQAKMGKANPQDPYIVARVLGKDAVPLSHFTDPEDQKIAKQMGFKDGPAALAPAKMRGGNDAAAPAAAPGLGLKSPNSGGFAASLPPADGSDDRRVGGQGLKLPAQTPVTSVAAAQAALGAGDNPEAAMGAGQYPRVGPNTKIAPNSAAADDEMNGVPVAPVAGNQPGGVAFNQAKAAPGQQATKVARFKELIAKAKELRTDDQVKASKDLGSFAGESTTYFLNKLRLIESRQLNEALTPEEQAEMDDLSAELGQQGAESDPELMAVINDYNSLKNTPATAYSAQAPTASASAPAPAGALTDPRSAEFDRINKRTGQTEPAAPAPAAAPASAAASAAGAAIGRPFGSGDESITRDPGVDPNISLNKILPILKDVTRFATHKGQVVAVNQDGVIRGVYDGKGGWKAGQGMPDDLQNVKVPAQAAASAPAAATSAPAAAGRPAQDAAAIANANYSYVEKGSDQALAIDNGYGYNVAAWRAAGSPGKPRTQAQDNQNDLDTSSQPASANVEYPAEGPVNDAMTNTLNHQMAKNRNGIDPQTGQNISIQNPLTGNFNINPESGQPSIAPVAAPATAAPAYKGNAGAQKIQSLNKDIIKDVNKIYPGQKFKMPDGSTYTVKPGDTLDKIAKGAKPAGERIDVPKQQDQISNAPSVAPAAAPAAKPVAPAAAPTKPVAPAAAPTKPVAPAAKPTGKNNLAPDLKEAVTYADDQTLARIISLSRR